MARHRKKKRKVNGTVVFLLALLLFLVVFGILCLWVVDQLNQEDRLKGTPSSSSESPIPFDEGDIGNLLVLIEDDNSLIGAVVIRIDPEHGSMWTFAFPPDTAVDGGTQEIRLEQLYKQSRIQDISENIGTLSGISIDHYISVSLGNIEKILNYFDRGLIYQLPERIVYENRTQEAGKRTFAVPHVLDILRYESWSMGKLQRAQVQSELLAALVNQYLVHSRSAKMDDDFTFIVNNVKQTDIMISHYNTAKPGLTHLALKNSGSLCSVLTVKGSYTGNGEQLRFYTDDNLPLLLAQQWTAQ